MKFIKFASYNSFFNWFKTKYDDFPLIEGNRTLFRRHEPDEIDIYRLVDDRSRPIGLTFITNYKNGNIYIELFEIGVSWNGNGYARLMLDEIIKKYNPELIELCYPRDGYEAKCFWKHMGFHEYRRTSNPNEMYKKFKKIR